MSSSTSTMPAIMQRHTIRGHTDWVRGVVHLPGGRHIITCPKDGSLRLWDLESGAQVGEDWLDEGKKNTLLTISLSPNGKTVSSGSDDGAVRLWDVETRKAIAKWTGHTDVVSTLCWSPDGERLVSGSNDGAVRVWDIETSKTVLEINTGHKWVNAVVYSPNNTKIATGGYYENAVKIWDSKKGKLLATLKHGSSYYDEIVWSLAWTSDGKKLISGSSIGSIRIFDTATWKQITVIRGHESHVLAITLSRNGRLLASASIDKTARLWNLDMNLPVGPLWTLQHKDWVQCVALSDDGVLVTSCRNKNVYTWDVHVILKEVELEDLLSTGTNIVSVNTSPTLSLRISAVRHQKIDLKFSNRMHLKVTQEQSAPLALHSVTSHFWKLMLPNVPASSGVSMNFHQGFSMAWKPMIPPQRVALTLIPLQMHSSLAFLLSSANFDQTMLKRPNFRNPQRLRGCTCVCSWAACPHYSTALRPKIMKQTNLSNSPHLRG
ncbi:WD40 repeat-like protein [Suillus weaverae]|nr:WD40 repeat-like protein [Suillus weaverae]